MAAALGAKPLDAEKSVNLSLGAVVRFGAANLTVDAYRIKVRDRIVLSENLTQDDVREFLTRQGFIGVGGGRFFINGVDTTTDGVDVVLNWPWNSGATGKFDFTVAANFNKTDVTKVPETAQLSALKSAPPLFARLNILSFEEGQPRNKQSASVNWKLGQLGATLRATRYGRVLSPNANPALDVVLHPKTLVDLEARYALTQKLGLALGA
ncbi:MAG: TonB-dependent receptor domain-containing protein [Gammaproteobacteria bacterium]